jgi:hypothetical protein
MLAVFCSLLTARQFLRKDVCGSCDGRRTWRRQNAIDAVLGIVLHGSAYCTVAAGRRWIDAGERNKVVMSILTVSALLGAPFTVPSAMAKAGVLGDAVVIDGGKMQSGGGGASTQSMLDWTDEQWEAIRPKKK